MTRFEQITKDAETLADVLIRIEERYPIGYCQDKDECFESLGAFENYNCRACLLAWLKEEVPEDA